MPPQSQTLSQAQIDRCAEITNQRGAVFGFPQSGGPDIPAHYSFKLAQLNSNQLEITAQRETTGTLITEKKKAPSPLPEPPSADLDALINSIVDLIERQISLKPSA